jgi:hypothetical protein
MFPVILISACALAGALDLPGLLVVPLAAAGLLTISAPRIIEKIQRARMLQQARVASLDLAFFGINSMAVAAVSYLVGHVLKLAWS